MWNKLRFKEKSVKSPPLRKFTLHFLTYVFSERDFLQVVTHSTSNDKQRLKESKGLYVAKDSRSSINISQKSGILMQMNEHFFRFKRKEIERRGYNTRKIFKQIIYLLRSWLYIQTLHIE